MALQTRETCIIETVENPRVIAVSAARRGLSGTPARDSAADRNILSALSPNYNPECSRERAKMADFKQPGYVYLVHAVGTPRYKIGRSQDTEIRLARLQGQSPYKLELIAFYEHPDVIKQELRLHILASEYRVFGEWFELPENWHENLEHWFYKPDLTTVQTRLLTDETFAARARARREAREGIYSFNLIELSLDEIQARLDALNEEDAVSLWGLIQGYRVTMKAVKAGKQNAVKIVTQYRRVCFEAGFLLPGEFGEFEKTITPFTRKMKVRKEVKGLTVSASEGMRVWLT